MATFDLGNAISGMGSAVSEIAGDYAKTAIARNAQIDLMNVRATIEKERDARLNDYAVSMKRDVEQPHQTREREAGEKAQVDLERNVRQPHQIALQDRGFTHTETIAAARQKFDAEQNSLQRDLTREQIAAQRAIAAGNNAISRELAKMGGVVQPDKEGNVVFIDKAGDAKTVMDPNNPGQPLKTAKDLTPAAKQYGEVIKAQLVDLSRLEIAAMGDPTQMARIEQRRTALNTQMLNVLTGGISAAAAPATGSTGERPPISSFGGGGQQKPEPKKVGAELVSEPPGAGSSTLGLAGRARPTDGLLEEPPTVDAHTNYWNERVRNRGILSPR